MQTNDPIELIVIDGLKRAGVKFRHESDNKGQLLDFYLPEFDIYIECKQFHTERVRDQLDSCENVILIQGRKAARVFGELLHR